MTESRIRVYLWWWPLFCATVCQLTGAEPRPLELSDVLQLEYASDPRIAPDGKRVASGGFDNTAKVWDLETGQRVHTLGGTFTP